MENMFTQEDTMLELDSCQGGSCWTHCDGNCGIASTGSCGGGCGGACLDNCVGLNKATCTIC